MTQSPNVSFAVPVLLRVLWRRRVIVVTIVVLSLLCGAAIAWLKTPLYRSSVVLAPRQSEEQGGALTAVLGQMGGLASLAGLAGLGGQDSNDSLALLTSRAFFERFARDSQILPVLFSSNWDERSGQWKSTLRAEDIPTLDDGWELFNTRIRTISQDQKTGIVTLSITWKDRETAATWANALATRLNEDMRSRAIADSIATNRQLQEQLDKTSVVELQQAIHRLMEMQIKREVLARSRSDYAFAVVDPAVVSDADRFVSPKRALILLSALIIGFASAVIFVILREGQGRGSPAQHS